MTVDLKNYFLGQSGTLEYELDLSGLELGGVKPFCAPLQVEASFQGLAGSVELSARVRYTMEMPCDRCGEQVRREYAREFFHVLVREISNEQDDDAFVAVPDERLDLDELLREDVLLDLPSKFLCSPDCKGLCPKCGKNLNEGPCGCTKREIDPRLEILKSLL